MKFIIVFGILAFSGVSTFACDPKSDNKPNCIGKKVRHFHDPNYYWVCAGGEAVPKRCAKETGFDEAKQECIPFKDFVWIKPCAKGSFEGLDCNPRGDNKPDCLDKKVRNFNDPNYYWVCYGGEAVPKRCPKETGFDEAKQECLPFKDFVWTKPCQ